MPPPEGDFRHFTEIRCFQLRETSKRFFESSAVLPRQFAIVLSGLASDPSVTPEVGRIQAAEEVSGMSSKRSYSKGISLPPEPAQCL